MFAIGEILEYLGVGENNRKIYKAVVTESNNEYTTCIFYSTGKKSDPEGKCYGSYTFKNSLYERVGPPLSPQEKVLAKIKKLEAAYAQRMKEKQHESKSVSVQTGQRLSQTIGPATWHPATERAL